MARKKWKKEVVRFRDRYGTLDGFMNTAPKKAVVTLFFKDKRCYNLFSRLATPIASDALAIF